MLFRRFMCFVSAVCLGFCCLFAVYGSTSVVSSGGFSSFLKGSGFVRLPVVFKPRVVDGAVLVSWRSFSRFSKVRLQVRKSLGSWRTLRGFSRVDSFKVSGLASGRSYRFRAGVKRGSVWRYGRSSAPVFVPVVNDDIPDGTPGDDTPGGGTPGGDVSFDGVWVPPTVPAGRVLVVDPVLGDDDASGSLQQPLASVAEAWGRIPSSTPLLSSYRILLRPGVYDGSLLPSYWENKLGSVSAPIVLEPVGAPGSVVLTGDVNMFNVKHFWLKNINIVRSGDVFHCEKCSYVSISGSVLSGGSAAHETLKVNQSDHFNLVDSNVGGADDNAVDFVAVQYGIIENNRVHGAGDWCAYVKGGSAYVTVVGNEFYDCGTGGFTAGQGTGFEFMVFPWLQYEAYGVFVVDNFVHDVDGAGLGVNGGFNVLMAFNTLYRVGLRSHLVEFVHGSRSCDGNVSACALNRSLGGWGTTDEGGQWIPSRHVFFVNNVIYNPPGVESRWQHFTVASPVASPVGSGAPGVSYADDDLRILGNVIFNGGSSMESGVVDSARLYASNIVNVFEPDFVNVSAGDYRPVDGGRLANAPVVPVPSFDWSGVPVPSFVRPVVNIDRPPGALRR